MSENLDARLSTGLPGHPKTKKLVRRLGPAAGWHLVCLILWVRGNKPDGDLTGMTVEDIELAADWEGEHDVFVAALADLRFLDGEPGAYRMHDWSDHQPWSSGAKDRSAVARANASKKWGRDLDSQNKQNRSERLAEARKKGTHTPEEWVAMKAICGPACLRCGATDKEIVKDHITPIYKGGSDAIDNLQPLCRPCNARKGPDCSDLRPANWQERLQVLVNDACETPAPPVVTPAPSPSPSPSPKQEPIGSSSSPVVEDRPPQTSLIDLESRREARERRLSEVTQEAIETFNSVLGKPHGRLPKVSLVTDVRRAEIKRCLKTASEICQLQYGSPTIERQFWVDYWAAVAADPFKSGEQGGGTGHENWTPTFEYLTRPKTMADVFDKAMSEGEGEAHG